MLSISFKESVSTVAQADDLADDPEPPLPVVAKLPPVAAELPPAAALPPVTVAELSPAAALLPVPVAEPPRARRQIHLTERYNMYPATQRKIGPGLSEPEPTDQLLLSSQARSRVNVL